MTSFKKIAAALAFASVAAGSALAAPVTYNVDSSHTFPRFSYSHFGLSTQLSSFSNTTGKVVFDAEAKTGSVDIEIDMTSVNTGSTVFNGHIQAEDFFHTAKFPKATFQSSGIRATGPGRFEATGQLNIKGQVRPVVVPVQISQAQGLSTASGQFKLKRLDFKVGDGDWRDTSIVADEVEVRFKLALRNMPPL